MIRSAVLTLLVLLLAGCNDSTGPEPRPLEGTYFLVSILTPQNHFVTGEMQIADGAFSQELRRTSPTGQLIEETALSGTYSVVSDAEVALSPLDVTASRYQGYLSYTVDGVEYTWWRDHGHPGSQ